MQHPVGYVINNGRVELADLVALNYKSYLLINSHTVLSGLVVTGYFVMAVSAYYLLRKEYRNIFNRSFKLGLLCALIATSFVIYYWALL